MPETRILDRLDALYALGDKIGYSAEEDEAHRLARGWMEEAGLAVEVDDASNLIGRSAADTDVWVGSHLDSVPGGGKFDGMLGVVAGIEAVERNGRGSVVVFRDEERGCAGSRAVVASGRLPRRYVELHIEQGPVLLGSDLPLAVVTGIAGLARGEIVTYGHASHAGTTPMVGRADALVAAAELILQICDAASDIDDAVATVGRLQVEPGALNVIPERVVVSVDARAPDAERFQELIDAIGLDPTLPRRAGGDVGSRAECAAHGDRGPWPGCRRARLRRRPRRGHPRRRRRRQRDAVRPQPERRHLAQPGRADE